MAEITFESGYPNHSTFPAILATQSILNNDMTESFEYTVDYETVLANTNEFGVYPGTPGNDRAIPIKEDFNLPITRLGFENFYLVSKTYSQLNTEADGANFVLYSVPVRNRQTGVYRYLVMTGKIFKYATGGIGNKGRIIFEINALISDSEDGSGTPVWSTGVTQLTLNEYPTIAPEDASHEAIYLTHGFLKSNSNETELELSEVPDYADYLLMFSALRVVIDNYGVDPVDVPCSQSITYTTGRATVTPEPIQQDLQNFSWGGPLVMFDLAYLYRNGWEIEEPVEEYSPEVGPISDPDGYLPHDHDDSSDTIDIPDDPTIGVCNVGFVNVYKTGPASLQDIGVELFPSLQYTIPQNITGTDVTEAVVNAFNTFLAFLGNVPSFFDQIVASTLINYIIDCHVLPVSPDETGTDEAIKVGYKQLSAHGYRLSKDYVSFDCGTINLSEYYQGFADFSATQAKLFLPFVGFVPARPEWFYRDSLNVTYKFNIIDGSFMAYVRSTGRYVNNNNSGPTIVGQYSGNACVHLPITGVTYSNMVAGLVGAGAGAVGSAAVGNVAGVATSALNAANMHGDIPTSNAYSSSGSFLSCRRPFLLIERAVSNYSATYAHEVGIPSNVSKKLSSVKGFAIIKDVHLDGITATDTEKAEIERLLAEGVIL